MSSTWKKVDRFTVANGVGGTAMQFALQKLGWRVLYWNPTSSESVMRRWDDDDFARNGENASGTNVVTWQSERTNSRGQHIYNPVWGSHLYRFKTVMNRDKYYLNPVDDKRSLVGFGDSEPRVLARVPFFVGIAHAGYHVFPGSYGTVIEAHSTRDIRSIDNSASTFLYEALSQ